MARDTFHSHTHTPDPHASAHPDFGQQLLNFIKLTIFLLIALKIIQLVFLKYKKKLTLPERVERKYKYSHSQLLGQYGQDEQKLMKVTIENTIKNVQVEHKDAKKNKKGVTKKVMFQVQKNVYYDPKDPKTQLNDQTSTIDSKLKGIARVDSFEEKDEKNNKENASTTEADKKEGSQISQSSQLNDMMSCSKITTSTQSSLLDSRKSLLNQSSPTASSPSPFKKSTNKNKST